MSPKSVLWSTKRRLTAVLTLRLGIPMKAAIERAAGAQRISVGEWARRSLQGSVDAHFYADPTNRRIVGPAHRRPDSVRVKGGSWHTSCGTHAPTITTNSSAGEIEFATLLKAG